MIEKNDTSPAYAAEEKWGLAARAGFQIVPDVLLKNQSRLELTATEVVVLLNVLMHWWAAERLPFPRTALIAQRTGLEQRTVQRLLRTLVEKKVLQKVVNDDDRIAWDPSPLVARLEGLARSDPRLRREDVEIVA